MSIKSTSLLQCGSWTYQSDVVNFLVDKEEIDLYDFYDNQEWLLMDARLRNGTTRSQENSNESVAMVTMRLNVKRQSFYYVFNLVFPTTLVSLVAVIGFHAPINATGRRESKFRLGIMTLLSMSVMLLMLLFTDVRLTFKPRQRKDSRAWESYRLNNGIIALKICFV
ncbi:hypothetical protein TELCIR_15924 [Teladorsagia circumcincta]|uniref:Neurotransmitter-gated ion-channel ligand-binding domain-containing protein n=1 Tax=Teladorsagia circumcincta TaxID=45464 RepID=A0A2G9TX13_TELCI|nr:hypothetical protein TELCIR_15924 [Teladorsagia circumcincta]